MKLHVRKDSSRLREHTAMPAPAPRKQGRRDGSGVIQGHGNQGEKGDVHAERMRSHSRAFLTCLFRSYSVRMAS